MHLYTMDLSQTMTTMNNNHDNNITTTTTTWSIVGHYLRSDQQLQSLSLEHIIRGGQGLNDLFQGLQVHPSIQTLHLAYVPLEYAHTACQPLVPFYHSDIVKIVALLRLGVPST